MTPATAFVGRDQELAALSTLLMEHRGRLITLVGPGGAGKTRLALEALGLLNGTFTRMLFVDLAGLEDIDTVAHELAAATAPDASASGPGGREVLVVDTFDHVIDAASVVGDLLSTHSHLTVVVTSREALGLRSEALFTVDPLPVPDLSGPVGASTREVASVRLFEERARARQPRFVLSDDALRDVAEICVRLDGLPLALELAAAQTVLLPAATILKRLIDRAPLIPNAQRDLAPRHQTLDAIVAWSYDLLTPEQAEVFRWCAVFAGGFTLQALERVISRPDLDVLAHVASLAAKSLVRVDTAHVVEPRLELLRTVREFGASELQARGEWERARAQHAAYFVSHAETIEPDLRGPVPGAALDAIALDYPNFRSVLDWSTQTGNPEHGLRLAVALYRYWQARGPVADARTWLDSALERGETVSPAVRAAALNAAGVLAALQSDHDKAHQRFTASLRAWQSLNEVAREAGVLLNLGLIAHVRQRPREAEDRFERAYTLFETIGDRAGQARSVASRARVAREQGEIAAARELAEEALSLFRSVGDDWGTAHQLVNIGHLDLAVGDRMGAIRAFRQGLTAWRALGNIVELAECFEGIATARAERQPRQAARLLGVADALRAQSGASIPAVEQERNRTVLARVREHLREDTYAAAWGQGHALGLDEAIELASDDTPLDVKSTTILSSREMEVARMIGRGYSNKGIAESLVLSVKTVESHIKNIFGKLHLRRRAEVAAWAARQGLV
ncbi:MAG: hypothetical protein NVSMB2_15940 [Chloroflexota bacterium]